MVLVFKQSRVDTGVVRFWKDLIRMIIVSNLCRHTHTHTHVKIKVHRYKLYILKLVINIQESFKLPKTSVSAILLFKVNFLSNRYHSLKLRASKTIDNSYELVICQNRKTISFDFRKKSAKFQYLGHGTTRMENGLVIWKP